MSMGEDERERRQRRQAERAERAESARRRAEAHHAELARLRALHPRYSGLWLERDAADVHDLNQWEAIR